MTQFCFLLLLVAVCIVQCGSADSVASLRVCFAVVLFAASVCTTLKYHYSFSVVQNTTLTSV